MMFKRIREQHCYDFARAVQKAGKYDECLQVMKAYRYLPTHDNTALDFVAARINQVFNGNSDLILGFYKLFMPKQYAIEEEEDGAYQNRVLKLKSLQRVDAGDSNKNKALLSDEGDYSRDYKFFENIRKEKFRNTDEYKKILKCLHLYSKEIISKVDLREIVRNLRRYGTASPSRAEKGKAHEDPEKYERERGFEASTSKRRKIEKSLIDRLLSCEIKNPSYQPSTETSIASGRTELDAALLNDSWVSIETPPTGDDTYDCKKNNYQKNLFKCEDDRCERDRQVELVKGTIECADEFLQKVMDTTISQENIRIEDHFKVLHVGCIKSLYGGSWKRVVNALSNNAVPVLQDILSRLQKKLKEVESHLSGSYKNKTAVVYEKNFKRSLNHGNSSFVKQDIASSSSSSDKEDTSTSCENLSPGQATE